MFSGVPAGAPCAGNTKNNRNRTTNKDLFDFMKIFLGLNQRAARLGCKCPSLVAQR